VRLDAVVPEALAHAARELGRQLHSATWRTTLPSENTPSSAGARGRMQTLTMQIDER
jgi:hypothetical protein